MKAPTAEADGEMPIARFELITDLSASPESAFDLSLDVDVHRASMAASREVAIAGISQGLMDLNDEVTWQAWHFGVPWRMTSRITELERPIRFLDEQVRGPFAMFRHEHLFQPRATGTRMIDRVEFAAPLGRLGRMLERFVLSAYLEGLIRRRNDYLVAHATTL